MVRPVTRRDMLEKSLVGFAGLLFGERRLTHGNDSQEGFSVEHLNLCLPNGRPVWEQADLWERVADQGKLRFAENEAVRTTPLDPPLASNYNYHLLALGGRSELQQSASRFFAAVKKVCGFGWDSTWAEQDDWLVELFQRVFSDAQVGWVSLLGARRPAQFRTEQDSTIRVEQQDHQIRVISARPAKYLDGLPLLEVGRLVIPTRGLRMACQEPHIRTKGDVFATFVPRRVCSSRFRISERYEEVWLSLACWDDERRLRRGQIPAVPVARYNERAIRVRNVPLLNLVAVNPARMSYTVVVVEINPDGGDILSIRWNDLPLSAGLLCSSPVEHVGLCQAFRKLARC